MNRAILVLALFATVACGANGAPEPRDTGPSVTGEARIGVVGKL